MSFWPPAKAYVAEICTEALDCVLVCDITCGVLAVYVSKLHIRRVESAEPQVLIDAVRAHSSLPQQHVLISCNVKFHG